MSITRESKPAITNPEIAQDSSLEEVGATNLSGSLFLERKTYNPRVLNPNTILSLQRTHGNAYVQRLLAQQRPQAKKYTAAHRVATSDDTQLKEISPTTVPEQVIPPVKPIERKIAAPAGGRVLQRGISKAKNLADLYNAKKSLGKHRSHTKIEAETISTTQKVVSFLKSIITSFVGNNPTPQNCNFMVLGFGSMARKEMLMVSDVDLQIMMYGSGKKEKEDTSQDNIAYANALKAHVSSEWEKQRKKVKPAKKVKLGVPALQLDWFGGDKGIVYNSRPENLVDAMSPKTKKESGLQPGADYYADAKVIYQTTKDDYKRLRGAYEKIDNKEIGPPEIVEHALKALKDLNYFKQGYTTMNSQISVKNNFIRNLTLAVGGLYRLYRQVNNKTTQKYETSTLSRVAALEAASLIDQKTTAAIKELLLRSLKLEEGAGLRKWKHNTQLKVSKDNEVALKRMMALVGIIHPDLDKALKDLSIPQKKAERNTSGILEK